MNTEENTNVEMTTPECTATRTDHKAAELQAIRNVITAIEEIAQRNIDAANARDPKRKFRRACVFCDDATMRARCSVAHAASRLRSTVAEATSRIASAVKILCRGDATKKQAQELK